MRRGDIKIYDGLRIGGALGIMVTIAISVLNDFGISEIIYRGGIIIIGGAWCGVIIAWLNLLMPEVKKDEEKND